MLLNNIFLKVLSVILAISMWLIVATSEYDQIQFSVPVKLRNVPDSRVAVTDENLINVTLRGPRLILNSLSYNDINMEIDVSNFTSHTTEYRIKDSDISIPSGVEVVRVSPPSVNITIDNIISKKVDVSPFFVGEPAKGFKVHTLEIKPSAVVVEGAATLLNNITSIETLPINLSGKFKKVNYSVGMKRINGIKNIDPPQVEIVVTFQEDIIQQEFKNISIIMRNQKEGYTYKLLTKKADITVKGRSDILNSENIVKNMTLYVDVSGLEEGQYLRDIKSESSLNVDIVDISPSKARLEVLR